MLWVIGVVLFCVIAYVWQQRHRLDTLLSEWEDSLSVAQLSIWHAYVFQNAPYALQASSVKDIRKKIACIQSRAEFLSSYGSPLASQTTDELQHVPDFFHFGRIVSRREFQNAMNRWLRWVIIV